MSINSKPAIKSKMTGSQQTYTERYNDIKGWYKLKLEAIKYNAMLKEDLERKRRLKKKNELEDEVHAEELIEKKYRKDKTQIKIPSNTLTI